MLSAVAAMGVCALVGAGALGTVWPSRTEPQVVAPLPVAPQRPTGGAGGARAQGGDALPTFPGVVEFELGEGLSLNGAPMYLSSWTTGEPPESVRDFYLEWFERRSGSAEVVHLDDGGYTISAVVRGGAARASVVILSRAGKTHVFPCVLELQLERAVEDPGLPLTARAKGLLQLVGRNETSVSYEEPAESVESLLARLERAMRDQGWTPERRRSDSLSGELTVARGPERWRFDLAAGAKLDGVAVLARYRAQEALP